MTEREREIEVESKGDDREREREKQKQSLREMTERERNVDLRLAHGMKLAELARFIKSAAAFTKCINKSTNWVVLCLTCAKYCPVHKFENN